MVIPVVVPRATLTMEQGTIVRWLKKQGDPVQTGDTMYELETDKAVFEVPAPAEGILLKIVVERGDAAVDSLVGWIGGPGDVVPPHTGDRRRTESPEGRIIATPAARRRAAELGVTLERVTGTGPSGRITEQDVEAVAQAKSDSVRSGLARQVTASWQTVPHIHIVRRLDAAPLWACRTAAKDRGLNASVTDLLLFTLARILPQFPSLTSVWDGEALKSSDRLNLGFAVDTGDTVLTPVLEDAETLTLEQIVRNRRRLTEAARAKRLKASGQAAFTLTNLGMYGVDLFAPIIRLPETAMLAVGRVTQEPVVRDGAVVPGWVLWANLAADHRVTDGAAAARFLADLERSFGSLLHSERR
jgi:pyruvate dehydrogenase E2 component (dihydrolipoamide acetyltransferase)